jgi:hypothetical protein
MSDTPTIAEQPSEEPDDTPAVQISGTMPPQPAALPPTNQDIDDAFGPKGALGGDKTYYEKSRKAIIDALVAKDLDFGRPTDPTRFDLSQLEGVRQAIDTVFRDALSEDPSNTDLGRFRCALIATTAHATRRDMPQIVLCLFLALMERHWDRVTSDPPDPDYSEHPDNASAAGQYLLRCLAVQATYDNFATYILVLQQFGQVVNALNEAKAENGYANMLPLLLTATPGPFTK